MKSKQIQTRGLYQDQNGNWVSEIDGWLAILLADAPKEGYVDLTAAMNSAMRRSFAGERCVVRRDADDERRVLSRSFTKRARQERDRFFAAQQ